MQRSFTLFLFCFFLACTGTAQVRPQYLYNTNLPYGTLDIRTTISSTHYYYLEENKTFSFRENAAGMRTNTFRDLTSWDSSPYREGHLRLKNGAADRFVMNYRMLMPNNYQAAYGEGYPMIVIMHGAVERGNCYYDACYHGSRTYDPNVNSPPAPATADHKLLNNDHHLVIGAKPHLDARNLAGTKLPDDPTLPARAFQGFVLMPQMINDWDSLSVEHMIRIVQLHIKQYNIDPNRIYIHGLSIGGFAVYQALKRASWLFAAALPMSAVHEAGFIFKHKQAYKVVHIPIWVFQGGTDPEPTKYFTRKGVATWRSAGGIARYTLYSDLGHNVWNRAYGEPDFFTWMRSKNKADVHAYRGLTVINKSKNIYPKLMLAPGFLRYQWERDGVVIPKAGSAVYIATTPGTYRARFSRISARPKENEWNRWSAPVRITESTISSTTVAMTAGEMTPQPVIAFAAEVFPNPASNALNVEVSAVPGSAFQVQMIDHLGERQFEGHMETAHETSHMMIDTSSLADGMYIVLIRQGNRSVQRRVIVTRQ